MQLFYHSTTSTKTAGKVKKEPYFNSAATGGAIYCVGCNLQFEDSIVNDNYATSGGFVYIDHIGSTSISFNYLSSVNNYANENGGLLYDLGALRSIELNNELLFEGNNASISGGSFYSLSKTLNFTVNTPFDVKGCSASTGDGGFVYL